MGEIIVSEKVCHKGRLHASIGYGGAVVSLSHGYGLKFIALDEKFVAIQVIRTGIDSEVKNQNWQKPLAQPKVTKEKKELEIVHIDQTESVVDLL